MTIRAAFYYPWFPETWGPIADPFTNYHPTLGEYSSSDEAVIEGHIWAMKYAKIDAGIASWWGRSTFTDQRLTRLLTAGERLGFNWCPYYEQEGTTNPTVEQIRADLDYLFPLTSSTAWAHVNGKPVIFVYAGGDDAAAMVKRWVEANAGRFYLNLKVFGGYRTMTPQPDSWHQYGPAVNVSPQLPFSFSVSPGFWKKGESTPRLVRDPKRFRDDVAAMVQSGAAWQLITTFNEWGEGTAIEPANEWGSTYLDILHRQ